jgi:hypothetical protein
MTFSHKHTFYSREEKAGFKLFKLSPHLAGILIINKFQEIAEDICAYTPSARGLLAIREVRVQQQTPQTRYQSLK